MSAVKHFVSESVKRLELDEFLRRELDRAGYGGVDLTKTPLGTRVTVYAMKPGLVIGKRGQNIRDLATAIEQKFGIPSPQVAVAEIEVPELNPAIMASKIAALQRQVHYRKAGYWTLSRIMEAGAAGVEITIRGKLHTERARYEKFKAGYMPKCGDPALKLVRTAVTHVQLKPGTFGIKVKILPPNSEFPDKVELKPQPTATEETKELPSEQKEES